MKKAVVVNRTTKKTKTSPKAEMIATPDLNQALLMIPAPVRKAAYDATASFAEQSMVMRGVSDNVSRCANTAITEISEGFHEMASRSGRAVADAFRNVSAGFISGEFTSAKSVSDELMADNTSGEKRSAPVAMAKHSMDAVITLANDAASFGKVVAGVMEKTGKTMARANGAALLSLFDRQLRTAAAAGLFFLDAAKTPRR